MPEISLNILDVAENSTRAKASLVEITVDADTASDRLTIVIKDNGCGMTEEQVAQVTDPFLPAEPPARSGWVFRFLNMRQKAPEEAFPSNPDQVKALR